MPLSFRRSPPRRPVKRPAGPRVANFSAARQQVVLQAALDEFASHGFHGASLNRIVEAAGVSNGSMYCCFDGKEGLYGHAVCAGLVPAPDGGPPPPDSAWEPSSP